MTFPNNGLHYSLDCHVSIPVPLGVPLSFERTETFRFNTVIYVFRGKGLFGNRFTQWQLVTTNEVVDKKP